MKHKGYIILFILSLVSISSFAQQESQYTQYMYNTITVNPAYAGSRGLLSFNGLYRAQWIGLEGAPETINFSAITTLGYSNVGLGLSFTSDKIGPSVESLGTADFSYTIQTSYRTKLSFGLKAGFSSINVDLSKLNAEHANDPVLTDVNRIAPVVGAGVYFHSDKWYVGLSSPNFIETDHYDDVKVSTATEQAHFYLIGGYVFELNQNLKFKPAALVKAAVGAPLAVDASASFMFDEKLTLGLAYRWDAAVSALVGFQISDQLMLGYAYDYDTTELGNYNSGSHEIFLRFELFSKVRRTVNPRFF